MVCPAVQRAVRENARRYRSSGAHGIFAETRISIIVDDLPLPIRGGKDPSWRCCHRRFGRSKSQESDESLGIRQDFENRRKGKVNTWVRYLRCGTRGPSAGEVANPAASVGVNEGRMRMLQLQLRSHSCFPVIVRH
jgi:hypothetical protein